MDKIAVGPEAAGAIDITATPTENVRAVARRSGSTSARSRSSCSSATPRGPDPRAARVGRARQPDPRRRRRPLDRRSQSLHRRRHADGDRRHARRRDLRRRDQVHGRCHPGRLWPRNDEERQKLVDTGYDIDRVLTTDDLVSGDDVFVAATGVTSGALLRGVRVSGPASRRSIVMRSRSGTVRRIAAYHPSKVRTPDERRTRWPPMSCTRPRRPSSPTTRDPRRRRELGDDQEALRLDRARVDGEPARLPRHALHDAGLEDSVSGVILYDETLRQSSADGTPFAKLLADKGIIPDQGRHRREDSAGRPARR